MSQTQGRREDIYEKFKQLIFKVAMFGYQVEHEAPASFILSEVKGLHDDGQQLYAETKYLGEMMKSTQSSQHFVNNGHLIHRYNETNLRLDLIFEKLTLLKKKLELYKEYRQRNVNNEFSHQDHEPFQTVSQMGPSSQNSNNSQNSNMSFQPYPKTSSSQPMSQNSNKNGHGRSQNSHHSSGSDGQMSNPFKCIAATSPNCTCRLCIDARMNNNMRSNFSTSAGSSRPPSSLSSLHSWPLTPARFTGLTTTPLSEQYDECRPGCRCEKCRPGSRASVSSASP